MAKSTLGAVVRCDSTLLDNCQLDCNLENFTVFEMVVRKANGADRKTGRGIVELILSTCDVSFSYGSMTGELNDMVNILNEISEGHNDDDMTDLVRGDEPYRNIQVMTLQRFYYQDSFNMDLL